MLCDSSMDYYRRTNVNHQIELEREEDASRVPQLGLCRLLCQTSARLRDHLIMSIYFNEGLTKLSLNVHTEHDESRQH